MPIAAPSANLFSHTSPTKAQHVLDDLGGRIEIILDGGSCPIGVESTIINLLSNPPQVLRPGGIGLEALQAALPEAILAQRQIVGEGEAVLAPGMLPKHYAPRSPLTVLRGPQKRVLARLQEHLAAASAQRERCGVLACSEMTTILAADVTPAAVLLADLGPENDLAGIASRLFATLRSVDRAGVARIYVAEPEDLPTRGGLGPAIHDRLTRAASGRIEQA